MKILTFNVRQWFRDLGNWKTRAKSIRAFIEKENPDIILFQELMFPMNLYVVPDGYKRATGLLSFSHHIYCRGRYGVINHEWHLRWCRAAIVTTTYGVQYNLFSVHTRWEQEICTKTAEQIKSRLDGASVNIAGGDWNREPAWMRSLFPMMILENTGEPTFANWNNPTDASELDYFFITPSLAAKATADLTNTDSDHRPVILTI